MSRIKWDITELRLRRDELVSLLDKEHSRLTRRKIKKSIAGYNALFSYYNVNKTKPIDMVVSEEDEADFEKHILEYLLGILEFEYHKLDPELIQILIQSLEPYSVVSDSIVGFEIEPCVMTNDDLLAIVDSIFRSINVPSFYKEFKEIIDPKNRLLDIEYYKHRDSLLFDGTIVTDHYNNLSYGKILRGNTYLDITTTVHEIFHMLITRATKNLYSFGKGRFYNEVEGYFGTLLATEYLHKFDIKSGAYIDLGDHDIVSASTTKFAVLSEIASSYYKTGDFKFKDLKESFTKRNLSLPITKKSLHEYVPQDLDEIITSSLSYPIALDIFEIYKRDPELAIYKLKRVSRLQGKNIREDLEKVGVTFFEDGHRNLIQKGYSITKRLKR